MKNCNKTILIISKFSPYIGGIITFVERRIEELKKSYYVKKIDLSKPLTFALLFSKANKVELHSMKLSLLVLLFVTNKLKKVTIYDHNHSRYFSSQSKLWQFWYGKFISKVEKIILVNKFCEKNYDIFCLNDKALFEVQNTNQQLPMHEKKNIIGKFPPELFAFMRGFEKCFLTNCHRFIHCSEQPDLYGIYTAVDMIKDLKSTCHFGLVICVGDTSFNNVEYQKLKKYIEDNSLTDCIYILEEFSNTWPLCEYCDVFLRLTSTDGDSLSIYEALELGCKVIASNVTKRPKEVITYDYQNKKDLYDTVLSVLLPA